MSVYQCTPHRSDVAAPMNAQPRSCVICNRSASASVNYAFAAARARERFAVLFAVALRALRRTYAASIAAA